MSEATLGIDLGTQTTKAALVAIDGTPLASAGVPVALRRPAPGAAEQDAAVLEESALAAIRAVLAKAPPGTTVRALSIDAQMGGCVGVDADLEAVTVHESWCDGRSDPDRAEVLDADGAAILDANGIQPFIGPRVRRWLREDPDLERRLDRVLAPAGYVVGRLCGVRAADAVCDRTQANMYGCFDVRSGDWDDALADAVGIPARLLPRVVEPTEIVGRLCEDAAARCGLPAGTPVAAGCGDGTAGWLAAGAVAPGACVDTGGTSDHFAITIEGFAPDPSGLLTCMPSVVPGLSYLLGFTTGTGSAHRRACEVLAGGDYEALDQMVRSVAPGSGGVLCMPHPHGRVTPFEPLVRGAFVGIDQDTRPEQLARALLEAVAFETADWLAHARELVPGFDPVGVAAVGGAAQSEAWTQIKSDVLGLPLTRMQPFVNAARGAALVAAAAVGAAPLDAPGWHDPRVLALGTVVPDESARPALQAMAGAYRLLGAQLAPVWQALAAASTVPANSEPVEARA